MRYTEEEEFHILEGVSFIEGQDGSMLTVRAGDRFVIPRGFIGTWEVVETTCKTFVIYDQNSTTSSVGADSGFSDQFDRIVH